MANVIDSLLITLGLDSSGVDEGMAQTNAKINNGLKNLTTLIAPLAGAIGLSKLISDYTKAADELGKFSKKIRENITDVQGWQNAIDAAGYDSNGFSGTLTGLDQKLRDIGRRGSTGSYELRALGISARDSNGYVKTSTEILGELSQTADKMNPERFRRLTEKLGIDSETIRFLQMGSKEVGSLVDKYKDLAYTQKDADTSRKFNIAMGDLNKTFQAFAATGLRIIVPALTFIVDKFALIVNFLRKHEPFVKAFFIGLAAVILYSLLPAISAVAAGIWAAFAPLLPIIGIVAALALLFDDLWTYINGGKSALSDFWAIFGTGEEISEALGEAWEDLKIIGTALWNGVKVAAQAFFSYFRPALTALGNLFKNQLKFIKALFTGDFEGMIEAVKGIFANVGEYFVAVFTGAFNLIHDLFVKIFTGIADFFGGVLDSILAEVTNFIRNIVSNIPDFLLPDSIIAWAKEADKTVAEVGASMSQTIAPNASGVAGNASQGVSPSSVATRAVDNSSETNVNVGKIEVNATSNDPASIATATGNEVRKLANAGNKGVR